MAAMLEKKFDLGHGFIYYEIVKPERATIHQLKQYIQHEECEAWINFSDDGFYCWVCETEAPQEVIEKGMTILCMRVL